MVRSKEFDLKKHARNSWEGRVLEVDLEYPKELQELHNDFSLAPDNIEIKEKYCMSIGQRLLIYTIFLSVMLKN